MEYENKEKEMRTIVEDVGNFYGKYYGDHSKLYIYNGYEVYVYETALEAAQDWIYTMLEDDATSWEDELKFLFNNGVKVEGIRVVENKKELSFMASIDYPLDNGKTRNLSAGTYTSPKDAFLAREAAKKLREEFLDSGKDLEEFQRILKEKRPKSISSQIEELRKVLGEKKTLEALQTCKNSLDNKIAQVKGGNCKKYDDKKRENEPTR